MSIDTLVSRTDFAGAFKQVKPHVIGNGEMLDALRNVEIRFFEDHLTMAAVNRYTMAEARVDYRDGNRQAGEDGTTVILVNVDDMAYAVKRESGPGVPTIALQVKENTLVLNYTTTAPLDVDSTFPKLGHLWPKEENRTEQDSVMLNPAYLAFFDSRNLARDRFEKNIGLKLSFYGRTKPVVVTFGDMFRGLIMPIREAS